MKITIYSLPDCPKCDILKNFLNSEKITFESDWFNTENQTDFIMMNIFGNPPILALGNKETVRSSEELFVGETLVEEQVLEVLRHG
jgi:glutaredoxin